MSIINLNVSDVNDAGNRWQIVGTFQLANAPNAYVNPADLVTPGDILDFSKAVSTKKGDLGLASTEAPVLLQITARATGSTINYVKDPAPPSGFGPRRDKGGIRFFPAGVELATGNYPAAALTDTYDFIAEFRKLI